MKRLLLLSNSRNSGQGYLAHAETEIKDFFTKQIQEILFVPFAGVRFSYDEYTNIVGTKFAELDYKITSIHTVKNPKEAVKNAQAIAVGGGNTFQLLKCLYETELLDLIRQRANEGLPYMGWSAGSNMACPTIKTTNDMPITEPPSFNALGLVPFQINPHYTDFQQPGHQGETRDDRLEEFTVLNPDIYVVGLREGSLLKVTGDKLELLGGKTAKIFKKGQDPVEYSGRDSLEFLLR